jgi:hypothetical protein
MRFRLLVVPLALLGIPLTDVRAQEPGDAGFRDALIVLLAEMGAPPAGVLADPRPVQNTLAPFPADERIIFADSDSLVVQSRRDVLTGLGLGIADAVVAEACWAVPMMIITPAGDTVGATAVAEWNQRCGGYESDSVVLVVSLPSAVPDAPAGRRRGVAYGRGCVVAWDIETDAASGRLAASRVASFCV